MLDDEGLLHAAVIHKTNPGDLWRSDTMSLTLQSRTRKVTS